jgi:hypothetical protein
MRSLGGATSPETAAWIRRRHHDGPNALRGESTTGSDLIFSYGVVMD